MNEQVRNDCCDNNCNNWSNWNNTCGCQNGYNACCNNCGTWNNTGGSSWNWIWWIIIFVVFLFLISGFTGNGCF